MLLGILVGSPVMFIRIALITISMAGSRNEDRMTAQGEMLAAMFAPPLAQ
jgi:hypothetical protein